MLCQTAAYLMRRTGSRTDRSAALRIHRYLRNHYELAGDPGNGLVSLV